MSVLITGGAGYIGAHVTRLLEARGDTVVVVDDLSTGDAERIAGTPLVRIALASDDAPVQLADTMRAHDVDRVVHLAARKQVPESVQRPEHYYRENLAGLAAVVEASAAAGVAKLVFSSSAAVYGAPAASPVTEDAQAAPINPYGETKLAGEWLVRAAARAHGVDAVVLRYFNVAGAGWDDLGDPMTLNLVTIAIDRLRRGVPPVVFGDGYPTPDGTGVRDYVHVLDLASAHLAALDALDGSAGEGGRTRVYNVGTGRGASVLEVLDRLATVSGIAIAPVVEPARAGDPAEVVADASAIAADLGWRSQHDLDEMIESAWRSAQHAAGAAS